MCVLAPAGNPSVAVAVLVSPSHEGSAQTKRCIAIIIGCDKQKGTRINNCLLPPCLSLKTSPRKIHPATTTPLALVTFSFSQHPHHNHTHNSTVYTHTLRFRTNYHPDMPRLMPPMLYDTCPHPFTLTLNPPSPPPPLLTHLPGSRPCCRPQALLQVLQQPTQHEHGLAAHHLLTKVEDEGRVNVTRLAKRLGMRLSVSVCVCWGGGGGRGQDSRGQRHSKLQKAGA